MLSGSEAIIVLMALVALGVLTASAVVGIFTRLLRSVRTRRHPKG